MDNIDAAITKKDSFGENLEEKVLEIGNEIAVDGVRNLYESYRNRLLDAT